jgi:hypothetical protein
MNLIQTFNALDGTQVQRKTLLALLRKAKAEKNALIAQRIATALASHTEELFLIVIKKNLPETSGLTGVREQRKPKKEKISIKTTLSKKRKVQKKPKKLISSFVQSNTIKDKQTVKKIKSVVSGRKGTTAVAKGSVVKNQSISDLEKLGFVSASKVPATPKDVFYLPGAIGQFLQKIQPHKALILIKGTKHTSKSQLAMQLANGFAEMGKPVAYIDYEQGGMESKDTIDSLNRNTTTQGRKLIAIKGFLEKPIPELKEFCKYCGVIVADSVTDLGITADQLGALRVEFPKVIWVFISQVKENGAMYGGNKMAHNPTVIIQCHPAKNPKERIATLEKNRGNNLEINYSIFYKKIIDDSDTKQSHSRLSFEVY